MSSIQSGPQGEGHTARPGVIHRFQEDNRYLSSSSSSVENSKPEAKMGRYGVRRFIGLDSWSLGNLKTGQCMYV